jgi:hypothetical protein
LRVLRKIFESKRNGVTGKWSRLRKQEFRDLYSSPNIIRVIKYKRMIWAGHVAHMGEKRAAYMVLVARPEEKRPLGRPRRRREDNIKMDFQELGWRRMDRIDLAQDRDRWRALLNAIRNVRVPYNVGSFLSSRRHDSFSGRTLFHGVS